MWKRLSMSETVLFRERLPKYVFNSSKTNTKSLKMYQWSFRPIAAGLFLGSLYVLLDPQAKEWSDPGAFIFAMILAWTAILLQLYRTENRDKDTLDGSLATTIFEDRISIPPRLRRKLIGRPDYVRKEKIDRIRIRRDYGFQYITENEPVYWADAPTSLVIVTRSGKKVSLGNKPPSTVREIVDVLIHHWNVRVEDPGSGMGRGTIIKDHGSAGEYSFEEIMNMNLFEWKD